MKKRNYIFFIVIVLLIFLVGNTNYSNNSEGYIPSLVVQGDVAKVLKYKRIEAIDKTKIKYKDQELEVFRLEDIIDKADPVSNKYDIIFSATDGLRARISGIATKKSYINFSEKNGWEAINLNHPVSSNIKFIRKITIVSRTTETDKTFRIISADKNIIQRTPGQLLAGSYLHKPIFEGSSKVAHNGRQYGVEIYSEKRLIRPEDLIDMKINKRSLVIGEKGKTLIHRGGLLELENNQINYINSNRKVEIENCRGMVINASLQSNKSAFYDTLHYLEKGQSVMVILLDGFGFHQYKYCVDNDIISFMADIKKSSKVLTSFRPVTNTGLAAVLTGKGPEDNGVYSHSNKNLKVSDLFQKAKKLGLESKYIEGNIKILNTSIDPILNPDINENGTTDDEVFIAAEKEINSGISLLFVHFHGIDDMGHDSGPFSKNTLRVIKRTDNYIKKLAERWAGKIIITSDHGMHSISEHGDHGSVLYQDIFVPYLITGGSYNE
jgi:hypothetical protein